MASSLPIQKVVETPRGGDQRSRVNMLAGLEDGKEDLKIKNHFPLADLYSRITERWLELSWELSILTKLRKHSTQSLVSFRFGEVSNRQSLAHYTPGYAANKVSNLVLTD